VGRKCHDPNGETEAALPQRKVHGKIITPSATSVALAKLSGAVEWVNDPDAFGGQPARIIGSLF